MGYEETIISLILVDPLAGVVGAAAILWISQSHTLLPLSVRLFEMLEWISRGAAFSRRRLQKNFGSSGEVVVVVVVRGCNYPSYSENHLSYFRPYF